MKTPVLVKLPFGRAASREAARLPFPEDAAKARAERYRRLFAALAAHADVLVEASAKGALTHDEALAALQRHARRFQVDLQALEGAGGP